MRSIIFAALVAAATISVASAENDEDVTGPSPPPKPPQAVAPVTTDPTPGISVQQQAAIPYHPCVEALGWVNGRLRCDNRY